MKNYILFVLLCLVPHIIEAKPVAPDTLLASIVDGPYIIHDSLGTGVTVIKVDRNGRINKFHYDRISSNKRFKVQTSDNKYSFDVRLHNVQQPQWECQMPDKILITSDPHGNFDCLYSLLLSNGVIDSKCNWTFGNAHLAVIGDVMDRGNDVTAIYWLLYKLEAQAAQEGGAVHFILGNHEQLLFMDDNRYTEDKYLWLAESLGIGYSELFSPRSELGRWILSRNTVERIGNNVLVHAGLSPELLETGLSIPEINALVPAGMYKTKDERRIAGDLIFLLHGGTSGPIWYRGLVKTDEKYRPASSDSLNMILDHFGAERIIVGHTIFDDISTFHDGRVVSVNVNNEENRAEGRGRALLIDHGVMTVVK